MPRMRSVEATRAAWKAPAKGPDLLLLQALSSFADETFECHPSVATLAKMIRKSERQTIRLLHGLRDRQLVDFENNRGGQRKCNRYRLLSAFNSVANPDTPNPDRITNPDTLTSPTLTKSAGTLTKRVANPDIAMSEEWLEGFIRVRKEWLCQIEISNPDTFALSLRESFQAFDELDPLTLLGKIQNGIRVTRKAICNMHGQFVLTGWRFDNWIAWAGREQGFSESWTGDEGSCPSCCIEHQARLAERPELSGYLPREFGLETPAICAVHGPLILTAGLCVYPSGISEDGLEKIDIRDTCMGHCPHCESDTLDEMHVQDSLGLSHEEWALRGGRIMAALAEQSA